MIAGLETISEGSLLIDGIVANELKPKDRNLTMVFQNYALYPHMTVKDNILFGVDIKESLHLNKLLGCEILRS